MAIGVHDLGRDRAGKREPHARQPVGDEHGVGLVRGEHPPDPQLVQPDVGDEDVVPAERAAQLPQRPRGLHRERVVVPRALQPAEDDLAQAGAAPAVRHVAALLRQAAEHVVQIADQLDLGGVERVDLRRRGVDHDDLLVALGVPVLGRVLDQVVADRQHDVGVLEPGHRVVA